MGSPVHANIFAQQYGGLPPLGENEPLPPPTMMHGKRQLPPPHQHQQHQGQQQQQQETHQAQQHQETGGGGHLGVGDGTSLSALATMRQSEAVWTGTLHRRRRLREGEPYGQTAEVSDAMAAVDASANDPYWTLAVSSFSEKRKLATAMQFLYLYHGWPFRLAPIALLSSYWRLFNEIIRTVCL